MHAAHPSSLRSRWPCSTARGRQTVVAKVSGQGGGQLFSAGENNKHLQKVKSLPLSLFTPYQNLPDPGQIVDEKDLRCDTTLYDCRTPVYVYEEKCASCNGTGYVRRRSGRRGGRGHAGLDKCLMCTGLGYVRLTTARYEPDVPVDPQDDSQFSVARTLPLSERQQKPKFNPKD